MDACDVGAALLDLRRNMIWEGEELGDCFHASPDKPHVRNKVFEVLSAHNFSIQATIMEKSKAQHHVRANGAVFYRYAWYYHFKNAFLPHLSPEYELLITAESIGTRKVKADFKKAANEVLQQLIPRQQWQMNYCDGIADPCLQVADYCSWALYRKWERGDPRPYALIEHRMTYEYELWAYGQTHYY